MLKLGRHEFSDTDHFDHFESGLFGSVSGPPHAFGIWSRMRCLAGMRARV